MHTAQLSKAHTLATGASTVCAYETAHCPDVSHAKRTKPTAAYHLRFRHFVRHARTFRSVHVFRVPECPFRRRLSGWDTQNGHGHLEHFFERILRVVLMPELDRVVKLLYLRNRHVKGAQL